MSSEKYIPERIEGKWQKRWEKTKIYKNYNKNKKYYVLDMFPYPSGAGLHVGHPKGYIATDIMARYKLLQDFSVLHPMGWDAFGLPAENYAIKNKIHPAISVKQNIRRFKKQLRMFGFTYDWDREINTTDPKFYKWTQWIFLKLFEKGLAYESNEPVNWCPNCKTVLANEDLENGLCERCGAQVIQRKVRQWVLKITKYADKLLAGLDKESLDWEKLIKENQINWIGRSEGTQFKIKIKDSAKFVEVYTTRIDTVFGMTHVVIAPEHPLINSLRSKIKNYIEIKKYLIESQKKTELERTELQKTKEGILLKGLKAINPFNGDLLPIFVADYVLGFYGTGAVMAVPAHDDRDFQFAKKYKLPIKQVIINQNKKKKIVDEAFTSDGILINSSEYCGLSSQKAREKMTEWLKDNRLGDKKVNYKMRDWVFSRQRYWGEPIPVIHCNKCGVVPVPEKELPLKLPEVKEYEPTGTDESPLANISEWINTKCPKCGGAGRRETNTMPQWAGSSWYFLRFIDPKNNDALVDKNKEKDWMPVDLYVGGAEHATRHLLYARFWHKFLYDLGYVSTDEPFKKLIHVGLVNGEDGKKMSKRWGNVINPDDVISQFGADSLRLYEMFMGPFSQNISWSTAGVSGAKRFLDKVWKLRQKVSEKKNFSDNDKITRLLHKTIKRVTEDIENFHFNTAVSSMMILVNGMEKEKKISLDHYRKLLLILSPFVPHITEEIWFLLREKFSIFNNSWPIYDKAFLHDETVTIAVQINGKLRDRISVKKGLGEEQAKKIAQGREKFKKYLSKDKIKKIIFVEDKILNFVI